jgi:predicted sulfurtransferase
LFQAEEEIARLPERIHMASGSGNTLHTLIQQEVLMRKKEWRWFVALAVTLVFTAEFMGAAAAEDVPRITKEDLKGRLGDPNVVIIDVRTGSDWKASDLEIKGAIREEAKKVSEWASKFDKNKTIVVYCA